MEVSGGIHVGAYVEAHVDELCGRDITRLDAERRLDNNGRVLAGNRKSAPIGQVRSTICASLSHDSRAPSLTSCSCGGSKRPNETRSRHSRIDGFKNRYRLSALRDCVLAATLENATSDPLSCGFRIPDRWREACATGVGIRMGVQ